MFKPNLGRGSQSQNQSNQRDANTASGPLKLPQLWNAPTLDNMSSLLSAAQKRKGFPVEQPFSVDGNNKLFQLHVLVSANGDPHWTLLSGDFSGLSTNWTLPSIDLQLVHNLVVSESSGTSSVDMISDKAEQARSKTGNFAMPQREAAEEPPSQHISQTISIGGSLSGVGTQRDSGRLESTQQAALEGDLEKLALPAVLQSLNLGKKTGRLGIGGAEGGAEVFMQAGEPIHAITGDLGGDKAMVEMLTWTSGKFKFFENELSADGSVTVSKRLDSLIIESMGYLDQLNYLKSIGLTMETFLRQAYPNLSEAQFEQMASRGTGFDLQMQKDFFIEIDDQTNLFDLLRRTPLTRQEWVPIIYNLLQVGLVQLANQANQATAPQVIEPTYQLDESAIANAMKSLMRPETEVFNYPVLQYFVKQELSRYERDGKAFSLMVFDLMMDKEGGIAEFIPTGQAKALLHRIKGVKREIDVLAHFETFDYGLLLPQTGSKSAVVVAQRILERIKSSPVPGIESYPLNICFGIAAIPQDCKSVGGLLNLASEAKKNARKNNLVISEYKPNA